MASSLRTKLRIAASVLLATGFWDAIAGRFVWQPGAKTASTAGTTPLSPSDKWHDLAGAVHIHTTYSDGVGSVSDVMEAAQKANVDWVFLADHNTQAPLRDNWEQKYQASPLLLIGTEVTVEHGAFLLALEMPQEWEPTRDKKPQKAIDEIRAHRGLPLVSLPFDVKHPWRDWDATGYEGLEIINLSTVARRHINLLSLIWLWPIVRTRGMVAGMTALLTRPDQALTRWDAIMENGTRRMIGLGALDAHAQTKIGRKKYPFPTYEETFRMVTTHALVPPTVAPGDETRAAVYHALREGRCYVAYDAIGETKGFSFCAQNETETKAMGSCVPRTTNGETRLFVSAPAPPTGAKPLVRLLHNGKIVASGIGGLQFSAREPGAYRVEVFRYSARLGPLFLNARPWIFSNPIYVR